MEPYTDFVVSYLIHVFVNEINTKLRDDCRVIMEFQIFRKNILYFMKLATMCCTNRSSGVYPLNQGHMM